MSELSLKEAFDTELKATFKSEKNWVDKDFSDALMEQFIKLAKCEGLSHSQLAEKIGISKSFFAQLKSTNKVLNLKHIMAIVNTLGYEMKVEFRRNKNIESIELNTQNLFNSETEGKWTNYGGIAEESQKSESNNGLKDIGG